jgi:hypothetical protein
MQKDKKYKRKEPKKLNIIIYYFKLVMTTGQKYWIE